MGRNVLDCSRSGREGREWREGRSTVRGLTSVSATYRRGEAGRTRGRDRGRDRGREGGREGRRALCTWSRWRTRAVCPLSSLILAMEGYFQRLGRVGGKEGGRE